MVATLKMNKYMFFGRKSITTYFLLPKYHGMLIA